MIKRVSIGRMEILRRFSRLAILVQMHSFRDKTQKPRAVTQTCLGTNVSGHKCVWAQTWWNHRS